MKTNQELLDFYGVEIGKKYKIIDERPNTKTVTSWIGRTFIVKQDERNEDRIVIELIPNRAVFFISRLESYDYEEVKPDILTDKEKAYLSVVIEPIRDRVISIAKLTFPQNMACVYIEYKIDYGNEEEEERTFLHKFNRDKAYLGMENNKSYTVEELGL